MFSESDSEHIVYITVFAIEQRSESLVDQFPVRNFSHTFMTFITVTYHLTSVNSFILEVCYIFGFKKKSAVEFIITIKHKTCKCVCIVRLFEATQTQKRVIKRSVS